MEGEIKGKAKEAEGKLKGKLSRNKWFINLLY